MRNLLYLIIVVSIFGCEMDPINIVYGPPSNAGDQKVLLEEFTGVQCTFCPQGSDEIASLISLNQGNVVAISIHAGFFATPTPSNKFDFRTADGTELYDLLGAGQFYPAAAINRVRFNDTPITGLVNNQTSWAGDIQQLRSVPAKAGLTVKTVYNANNRELRITLTGIAKEDFNEKLLANVMITESNIIDWQKDVRDPSGHVTNYVHKHLFRDAITPVAGDEIVTNPKKGQSFSKEYIYTVSDAWIAENCNIVGFITYSSKKDIIQVNEAKVVE